MKKRFSILLVSAVIIGLTVSLVGMALISQAAGQPANKADHKVNVLIGFNQTPGPAEQALVRAHGGAIKYSYNIVPAIAASLPEQAIKGLINNPHIASIELDDTVYAVSIELENSWGVKRIGGGTVHTEGNKGTGVKIGIIDSGINYNHPDLENNFDPSNRGYYF